MSWFDKKKKEKFKAKLTYGTDVVSLYEEAKRVDAEIKIQRDRIYASEEYERKAELEGKKHMIEQEYEVAIGMKYGFDPTETGTHFHLRDYIKDYNRCEKSPFGYHGVVWKGENRDNICIFCDKDLDK